MQVFRTIKRSGLSVYAALVMVFAATACGQAVEPTPAPAKPVVSASGKTVFYDSDGNQVSNNEFVDIRMANFHIKDATRMAVLDDGTVEFRLQKVPQEGSMIPMFSAKTIDGDAAGAAEWKGKVVVLNFWFIGCPICRAEMPQLNALAKKFETNSDVIFVAVTADPASQVKNFLSRNKFDYRMIADAQTTLNGFGFSGYPKNIVVGRDGQIVYWRSTVKASEKFESVIRQELAKN